jgi:hypothetical protein
VCLRQRFESGFASVLVVVAVHNFFAVNFTALLPLSIYACFTKSSFSASEYMSFFSVIGFAMVATMIFHKFENASPCIHKGNI